MNARVSSPRRQPFTTGMGLLTVAAVVALAPGCSSNRYDLLHFDAPAAYANRPVSRGAFHVGTGVGVVTGLGVATVPIGFGLATGSDELILGGALLGFATGKLTGMLVSGPVFLVETLVTAPFVALRQIMQRRMSPPPPPPAQAPRRTPPQPVAQPVQPVQPWAPPRGRRGPPRLRLRAGPGQIEEVTPEELPDPTEPLPLGPDLHELHPTTKRR